MVEVKKKGFNHYISANLGYDDKMELKKINDIYSNQNLSIKINVHQKNDIDKKIINNNDNDSNKTSSLSRTIMSNSDINKDSSDQFEYIVNNLLKGNIEKEKLINLANILYKFNFKLMKYNDKNNTIKFVSAYLNHISKKKDENQSENYKTNYCYGFKEIDSIFQYNFNEFICVDDLDYFDINLIYIKEEKNEYFKIIDKKEKKLAIYPNSIFFCEIKNTFPSPNISAGNEKVVTFNVEKTETPENYKKNYEYTSYGEQIDKLLKKFNIFYDLFIKNKIDSNLKHIQIVFLYDSVNIDTVDMDLAKIKKITESVLKKNEYKYKNIKIKTIFQLIFFDRNRHNIDYKKKAKEDHTELVKTKDELNETKNELSKTKNELNEAKNEINEKESRLTAANNELDKAKNEINEKESRLTEANNKLEEKIEIIKRLNEIIKNAKLDEKIKLELDKVFKGEK